MNGQFVILDYRNPIRQGTIKKAPINKRPKASATLRMCTQCGHRLSKYNTTEKCYSHNKANWEVLHGLLH